MNVKIIEQFNIYKNSAPELLSRQAVFPGVVQFSNGDLLAMFAIGQAFESSDMRTFVSGSKDNGKTWSEPIPMYKQSPLNSEYEFSEYYKPSILADGTVVAVGYGFQRPRPDVPLVNPVDQTFLPGQNRITFSLNNGKEWEVPRKIDLDTEFPLELSGPCVQLSSGRLVAAAPEFTLDCKKQRGRVICSDDGGKTWQQLSIYFQSPMSNIAPWESRICQIGSSRLAIIFWAYDTLNQKHLANHFVMSKDEGRHWSEPINTGIMAQASNLFWLGGEKILTIHSHRAESPGLCLRCVNLKHNRFDIEDECVIWSGQSGEKKSQTIKQQFASLRFGQPSLVRLHDGVFLAVYWCAEDCNYVIKAHRLEISI